MPTSFTFERFTICNKDIVLQLTLVGTNFHIMWSKNKTKEDGGRVNVYETKSKRFSLKHNI